MFFTSFRARAAISIVLFPILLTACNFPEQAAEGLTPELESTAIYQTLEYQLTANTPQPAPATLTPQVTQPGTPSLSPTFVPATTNPPQRSITPSPTPRCDHAAPGVPIDVTIPDDTKMKTEESFTKVWRLRNIGSCTWTEEYTVELFSGDAMGAPSSVALPKVVLPGTSVDIAVDMTTPRKAGVYQGNWMLRNANGGWFGIGPSGDAAFWVRVEVLPPPTNTPLPVTPTPTHTLTPELTPELPPELTPELTPQLTPEVEISGTVDLPVGTRIDLDRGQVDSGPGDDLWYSHGESGPDSLTPLGSSAIGIFGPNTPGVAECEAAPIAVEPVSIESLQLNTYLCYRTDQGLPGYLYFVSRSEENQSLTFEFSTWNLP